MEHGPFRRARFRAIARDRLDAAGAGSQSPFRCRRRAAAALRLPALRPPGRPDGELRRARWRASGRTSIPTTCSCCRATAAAAGDTAVRPIFRSGRAAGQDSSPTSRLSSMRSCRRATCCTCRPSYCARRRRRGRVHHLFDRIPRGVAHRNRAGVSSITCGMRLALDGRYADPDLKASGEPARIAAPMQRRVDVDPARNPVGPRGHVALPRHLSFRSQAGRLLRPARPTTVARGICAGHRPAAASRSTGARNGSTMTARSTSNGEAQAWPAGARDCLAGLANARRLGAREAAALSPAALQFLYDGYSHGFLHVA